MRRSHLIRALVCSLAGTGLARGGEPSPTPTPTPPGLESQLSREGSAALVDAARSGGDPARGAAVFFRTELACAKCHGGGGGAGALGPDLARLGPKVSGAELVEGILSPSKMILRGYEPVTVATRGGKTFTGLLVSDGKDALVIRDASRDGQTVTVAQADVEERKDGGPSVMPGGLVNLLASRRDFLDLLSYVLEVAEKGPGRAEALRPASASPAAPLPKYEEDIDHAGIIAGLGPANFRRGEAIYQRVCANCHGTKDRPGSLPTSLRFAAGAFKNGSDPFRMYQTLTHGFGVMAAQPWMVPEQKYDVIHYVREAYLKPYNPGQFTPADGAYLGALPKGRSRGPRPLSIEPWSAMDYGPSLMATVEVGDGGENFAYKGIAVRLDPGPGGVARGSRWAVFEHDTLRLAGGWTGRGFIDWNGINFNGRHEVHPKNVGRVAFETPAGPGWADPQTGRFDDPRLKGRDGRAYGPLPRAWGHYRGTYHHADKVVIAYDVGDARILESPGAEAFPSAVAAADPDGVVFTRTIEIGRSSRDLALRVAAAGASAAAAGGDGIRLAEESGFTVARVPASSTPRVVKFLIARAPREAVDALARASGPVPPLGPLTKGGPRRWPEALKTRIANGNDAGPFAADVLTHPASNPWLCQTRFTGLDFLEGGRRAAVCTWDGDVWLVDGLGATSGELSWRRIASGLFQPLGLKVVGGRVHVLCRDQIAVLHDLNGDGETDFYENFNSDHQVTEHFHEFAMDLQTDASGNFYYAKAARHGKTAVVPQHGTLLKVSRDGARTEILATGFRAPNGVCVNDDGTFFLTDQEGFWHPKNRINLVRRGGFYGNMWGYHDVTDPSDSAMEQPVCWITNAFDRSPGEMVRVTGAAWGALKGSLLNLSYGMGKVFVMPYDVVDGQAQGGLCELPGANFPTGVMRGRFHPADGQLYLCGMFAWAGNKEQPGGLYRLRATGKPAHLPVGIHASRAGLSVTFSDPLDRASATGAANYSVSSWSLKRSAQYGSKHYDERALAVASAVLSEDGRTVALAIPGMKPAWCMEVAYRIKGQGGESVTGRIDHTVHTLGP